MSLSVIPSYILWISAFVAVFILLFLWHAYNSFIRQRNQVKNSFADIDVQLKRRASLIENLVALVREYAAHENKTFEDVAKARSAVQSPYGPRDVNKIDNMLTQSLKSLLAVAEAYPKLQASENYQSLQDQLKETEDTIAIHREEYNQSVLQFNTMIQTFPNLMVAGLFGFSEEELFTALPDDTEDVEVKPA